MQTTAIGRILGLLTETLTVARRLSEKYEVRLYHCDDTQSAHTARSNPTDHPMLHTFITMTMDERWAKRTPEEMFHTFHGFHGEGFGLILEDLLDLPTDVPVLVEGYKLLPRLVSPLLSRPDQAAWLIPTPEWRRTALQQRGLDRGIRRIDEHGNTNGLGDHVMQQS